MREEEGKRKEKGKEKIVNERKGERREGKCFPWETVEHLAKEVPEKDRKDGQASKKTETMLSREPRE